MNYFSTDGHIPRTAWCAVYDSETGEVVHVHEFIGFEISDDSQYAGAIRAELAVAHVRQHTRRDLKTLAVVHGEPTKPPGIGDRLAFDLKTKKLVTSREPLSLPDFAKIASAADEAAPDGPITAGNRPKKNR